jgi:hypothetical protein
LTVDAGATAATTTGNDALSSMFGTRILALLGGARLQAGVPVELQAMVVVIAFGFQAEPRARVGAGD